MPTANKKRGRVLEAGRGRWRQAIKPVLMSFWEHGFEYLVSLLGSIKAEVGLKHTQYTRSQVGREVDLGARLGLDFGLDGRFDGVGGSVGEGEVGQFLRLRVPGSVASRLQLKMSPLFMVIPLSFS